MLRRRDDTRERFPLSHAHPSENALPPELADLMAQMARVIGVPTDQIRPRNQLDDAPASLASCSPGLGVLAEKHAVEKVPRSWDPPTAPREEDRLMASAILLTILFLALAAAAAADQAVEEWRQRRS